MGLLAALKFDFVNMQYKQLNYFRSNNDPVLEKNGRYLRLWGDAVFDIKNEDAIIFSGDYKVGKTTTAMRLAKSFERFKIMSESDCIIYDFDNKLVIPHYEGIAKAKIGRLVKLKRKGVYRPLDDVNEQTMKFIEKEIYLPTLEFFLIEGDIEKTVNSLCRFLG